jgi:hypothetical protein
LAALRIVPSRATKYPGRESNPQSLGLKPSRSADWHTRARNRVRGEEGIDCFIPLPVLGERQRSNVLASGGRWVLDFRARFGDRWRQRPGVPHQDRRLESCDSYNATENA